MDGAISGVDPDQVENDVGAMWRVLYKLEKQFVETPNPLQMAKKVRSTSSSAECHQYSECGTGQRSSR